MFWSSLVLLVLPLGWLVPSLFACRRRLGQLYTTLFNGETKVCVSIIPIPHNYFLYINYV